MAFRLPSRSVSRFGGKGDVRLAEESLESWDSIISDKFIYVAEPFPVNGEIRRCIGGVDWVSKLDSCTFDIELNFILFGERNSYFRCVINFVAPRAEGHADIMDAKSEVNGTDGND